MFEIYKNKTVLVTGHAGTKGSWLTLWLQRLGAKVIGYGHPPKTDPSHFRLVDGPPAGMHQDLLHYSMLERIIVHAKPDIIFHLAAKAIVARTFSEPRETFENNVMGAVNILEVCRYAPSVKGIVMVVTDKVYENKEWNYAYRENDELGGFDPYSASKVCIEHVIQSYRKSFGLNIAAARAGNIVCGGDWSEKRLIPDLAKATSKGEVVVIHTPTATRPFQHVLDALSGYLTLGQHILEGKDVNRAWNFGPEGEMTVLEVLNLAKEVWPKVLWDIDETPTHAHMVYLLKIDSTEAKKLLGWRPQWDMAHAIRMTILWYKIFYETGTIMSHYDIRDYEGDR